MNKFEFGARTIILIAFIICNSINKIYAVVDSTNIHIPSKISFVGYVDAYYAYDLNQSSNIQRGILANRNTPFYSHTNQNQISINNALLGARYTSDRLRAAVVLQTGTYVQRNYAAEPDYAKYIYETYVGVRLAKNLWIDAGVFTSHIGLESAVSMDNMVLTRSLCAENSPYYLSGAKITWETNNKKWLFSGLILNGWQTIQAYQRPQKAFGSQIQFKPTDKILLNASTYFGPAPTASIDANGDLNTAKGGDYLFRFFHNLYGTWQVSDRLSLAGSFDIGFQQISTSDKNMNPWYTPIVYGKYYITPKVALSGRVEYYNDKYGIIIPTGTANNFQASGFSLGIDYSPFDLVMLRLEGRTLHTTDAVFVNQSNGSLSNNCTWFTASIAAYLKK